MIPGYVEFEFDLPEALLAKLVSIFDGVTAAPLAVANVAGIPEEQGVYQLFLSSDPKPMLVYIGKTDAESGLRDRLTRHSQKIQHRHNLDPNRVLFKAVRIFVFTAVDLETQLINHYGGTAAVNWNGSGFGSNDPGKERDTTNYKPEHFDAQYPIDIERPLDFEIPLVAKAAEILRIMKKELPYLIRYESVSRRRAHADLEDANVKINASKGLTLESVLAQLLPQLPTGWHATMLPSHIIMYKNDNRRFPSGHLIAKS